VKNIRRSLPPQRLIRHAISPSCDRYFFCEKNSGIPRFHVEADPNGRFPVDWAAGMLAMHCLARGQSPSDYVVMVRAQETQLKGLQEEAEKLLELGHSLRNQLRLTRRESEVLDGLLHNFANKEIALSLRLSERTVKFHVSSLLAKFKVRSRLELVHEASNRALQALPKLISPGSWAARYGSGATPSYVNTSRPAAEAPVPRQIVASL
jgi:DNA-binding CsgD family transcriptional regulator